VKRSELRVAKTDSKAGSLSDVSKIRYNIYGESEIPLRLDKSIHESGIANLTDKKSEVEKNFWSNVSLRLPNSLKGISSSVLAKRLGFSLCQVFELIEAGSIICRNGLIPEEEAERLLQPKIEKV